MDSRDTCRDIEQSTVSNHVYSAMLYLFVVLLIAAGCKEKSIESTRLLCQAIEEGNLERVRSLIASGADVNAKDKRGDRPLYLAAKHGQIAVVELLIASGANVNAKSRSDGTPLSMAVSYGHINIAKLLIAKGANVKQSPQVTGHRCTWRPLLITRTWLSCS
jgi:ankyrin repeat protein